MGIVDTHARPYPGPGFNNYSSSSTYEYKVGYRNLNSSLIDKPCSCKTKGISHHCLLYNDEIFEFLQSGYHRTKKKDCRDFDEYEWFSDIQGTSNISPDNLDKYIRNFFKLEYNLHSNNCQHFVNFCLEKLDPNAKIIEKHKRKMCC